MKLFAFYDESWKDEGMLVLHTCNVKQTPAGFKALERTGLAFNCRTLFRSGDYETSEEAAREQKLRELRNDITVFQKEIEDAARGIALLEAKTYKRKESK